MNVELTCPRCGKALETIAHALRGCEAAREVWSHANCVWDQGFGHEEEEASRFLDLENGLKGSQLQQFWTLA
ncbi:hypothetical protein PTKIN_Ptkin12aG0187500 [Pterospermum kingtungense]